MTFKADVVRLRKLTQEKLLLEVFRDFPDLTDRDLLFTLDAWRATHGRSQEEIGFYGNHGIWPAGTRVPADLPAVYEEAQHSPRDARLLKIVERFAPGIPARELRSSVALQLLVFAGRTEQELKEFVALGYFRSHTPAQAENEATFIERFQSQMERDTGQQ